jgi:hypothetical protein
MLDAWNQERYYRELADECRRLAANTISDQMRSRYSLMAKEYILLADVEEQSQYIANTEDAEPAAVTSYLPTAWLIMRRDFSSNDSGERRRIAPPQERHDDGPSRTAGMPFMSLLARCMITCRSVMRRAVSVSLFKLRASV